MTSSKILNLSYFHLLARILLQEGCLPFDSVTLWSLMMVFMILKVVGGFFNWANTHFFSIVFHTGLLGKLLLE